MRFTPDNNRRPRPVSRLITGLRTTIWTALPAAASAAISTAVSATLPAALMGSASLLWATSPCSSKPNIGCQRSSQDGCIDELLFAQIPVQPGLTSDNQFFVSITHFYLV